MAKLRSQRLKSHFKIQSLIPAVKSENALPSAKASGDLIELGDTTEKYNIMQGIERMDRAKFFAPSHNARTRGHPLKWTGGTDRTDKGKYFFTQHVVNLWNSLPQDIVAAPGLDQNTFCFGRHWTLTFQESLGGKTH